MSGKKRNKFVDRPPSFVGDVVVGKDNRTWISVPDVNIKPRHNKKAALIWERLYTDNKGHLRCPAGSPLLEPQFSDQVRRGTNGKVWVAIDDRALTLRWKQTKRIKTKQLTLRVLMNNPRMMDMYMSVDVVKDTKPIYRVRPSGNIITVVDGEEIQSGTLKEAANNPSKFIGHYVEMIDTHGNIAPDEMQPTICTRGRLANNCITSESYLRVRV